MIEIFFPIGTPKWKIDIWVGYRTRGTSCYLTSYPEGRQRRYVLKLTPGALAP